MRDSISQKNTPWVRWLILGLILVTQITVLILAPEERTLGNGIKPVYYHVSLTWTGLLFLLSSFVGGIWTLVSGSHKSSTLLSRLLNSGFLIFGLGFCVSMYASVVNWGGVPFSEPPVQQAIGYMLAGVFFWWASWWIKSARPRGAVGALAAAMVLMATNSSQSILHPESPVNTSPVWIKATFYVMFGLGLALGIWSLNFQKFLTEGKLAANQ
jgi:hypothetical protein